LFHLPVLSHARMIGTRWDRAEPGDIPEPGTLAPPPSGRTGPTGGAACDGCRRRTDDRGIRTKAPRERHEEPRTGRSRHGQVEPAASTSF
jgi:hypothetical protein